MACRKDGLDPGRRFDLSSVRTVCAAGSPLPTEGYEWLYEQFGTELFLNVGSGGTDVCTGIVQGYPLLPVYAGRDVRTAASASTRRRSTSTGSRSSASSASS